MHFGAGPAAHQPNIAELGAPVKVMAVQSRRHARVAGLLTAMFGALPPLQALADTDVVVMRNGDALTGEVKSLDRGMLRFDTDATDTIEIQWTRVIALSSEQNFRITLDDSRQLFGSLGDSDEDAVLLLNTAEGPLNLPLLSVVRMTPIEGRLIDRIDMSVDLGYNFTKANNVNQGNFGYDFSYRSEQRLLSVEVDTARSSSTDEPVSIRSNSTLTYRRFINERLWDPIGIGVVERNDELGLDRRVTAGGGMSRWLTDTNTNRISFFGGVALIEEDERDALEKEQSVEAVMGLALDWFRYDDPEFDMSLNFSLYERLSDEGRTRGTLDVDLRWELVSDFFWGFTTYYTFNSQPTGEAASDDYGVFTTIGWSF